MCALDSVSLQSGERKDPYSIILTFWLSCLHIAKNKRKIIPLVVRQIKSKAQAKVAPLRLTDLDLDKVGNIQNYKKDRCNRKFMLGIVITK